MDNELRPVERIEFPTDRRNFIVCRCGWIGDWQSFEGYHKARGCPAETDPRMDHFRGIGTRLRVIPKGTADTRERIVFKDEILFTDELRCRACGYEAYSDQDAGMHFAFHFIMGHLTAKSMRHMVVSSDDFYSIVEEA